MKQAFDLTLGIVSELVAVDGKVLLDHAVRMPLTGFDLGAQQSC
jgi:hypothetical protein